MKLNNKARFNYIDLLIFFIILFAGVVNLFMKFHGDQALWVVGAKELNMGEVLYRDFWDIKQPGIYGFCLVAGLLFGFNEFGIHIAELIYMLFFTLFLTLTLKDRFINRKIGSLTPILSIGIYYSVSNYTHLTQVEALIGLPIFIAIWTASSSIDQRKARSLWLFLSGFSGGIVLLFKLVYLPILVVIWIIVLFETLKKKQIKLLYGLFQILSPIFIGALLPVIIMCGYFAWHDSLSILYKTTIVYPLRISSEIPGTGRKQFIQSLAWFIKTFSAILSLGTIGSYFLLKQKRDTFTLSIISWWIVGFGLTILQYKAAWQYHYLLLIIPSGILATHGLDFIYQKLKEPISCNSSWIGTTTIIVSVLILFSSFFHEIEIKASHFIRLNLSLSEKRQQFFKNIKEKLYPRELTEVAFLSEPGSLPGDICIFSNPLYLYLSERKQAIAINGWSPEYLLSDQWSELIDQLETKSPPYIFIDIFSSRFIKERSPQTEEFINTYYIKYRKSKKGIWYIRKSGQD